MSLITVIDDLEKNDLKIIEINLLLKNKTKIAITERLVIDKKKTRIKENIYKN